MKNLTITRSLLVLLGSIGSLSMLDWSMSIAPVSADPPIIKPIDRVSPIKDRLPNEVQVAPDHTIPNNIPQRTDRPINNRLDPLKYIRGQINGQITTTTGGGSDLPCSSITVKLIESIPHELNAPPGGFPSSHSENELSKTTATGNNLASGCSYQMSYAGDGKSVQNPHGSSSFRIETRGHTPNTAIDWHSPSNNESFQEVPSVLNLSMVSHVIH